MDLAADGLWRMEFSPPISVDLNERDLAEIILDRSRLAECNRAYAEQHGHEHPEAMVGCSLADLLPGFREEQVATATTFIRSGFRLKDRPVSDPGQEGRLFLSTVVGNVKDGFLTGCRGAQRDITEEQRLRGAVSESEETLRVFTQAIPEPALLMTVDGEVLHSNPAMAMILGMPLEEFLGSCVYDAMPEELARSRREGVAQVVTSLQPIRWEDHDGERQYLNYVYPVSDATGRTVRVAVCAVDITERQGARAQLARLAAAVEHAAEDIILLDADGIIQYVNPAFERTTGYSSDEAIGKSPKFLDGGEHEEAFYRDINTTVERGEIWKGRFHNRTKTGRLILQDATIAPIRDDSGNIVGYVSERRDVTREVEMERQAVQADKLQAIGTLAGGIAHDFNNILSAISGFAQMAQVKAPPDPKLQRYLQGVLDGANRATELVRQILTFSRRSEEEGQPVQVSLIAKEALKLLRASSPTTIDIQSHIRSQSVVQADPTQIHRMLVNLCTNATLAMRERGGVLRVILDDVEVDEAFAARHADVRPGKFLRLTVADTGCGMTDDVIARIFEPFYTTREKGLGSGMGLAVVHGVVKQYQGAIQVRSTPGEGSTFELYLPVSEQEAPQISAKKTDLPQSGGRVFFVDDESIVSAAVGEALREVGYELRIFPNALEALTAFEAAPESVDIVITDMTMPGMTGDELTRKLKAARPDLPVILCTGYSEKISAEGAASLGVDKFFMKPVDVFELARSIDHLLKAA